MIVVLPFTRIVELVVVVFRDVDHLWIKALVMRHDSPSVKSIQSVAAVSSSNSEWDWSDV